MARRVRFETYEDVSRVEVNVQHLDETVVITDAAGFATRDSAVIASLDEVWGLKRVPVTIDDLSIDELRAEAEERELEVTRADGKQGEPVKSDYVRALKAAEKED